MIHPRYRSAHWNRCRIYSKSPPLAAGANPSHESRGSIETGTNALIHRFIMMPCPLPQNVVGNDTENPLPSLLPSGHPLLPPTRRRWRIHKCNIIYRMCAKRSVVNLPPSAVTAGCAVHAENIAFRCAARHLRTERSSTTGPWLAPDCSRSRSRSRILILSARIRAASVPSSGCATSRNQGCCRACFAVIR